MTRRAPSLASVALLLAGCGADPSAPPTPAPAAPSVAPSVVPSAAPPAAAASSAAPKKGRFVYIHGVGNGKDPEKIAAKDDGCSKDDLASCHALGLALMTAGEKDSDNNKRALAAFEKACLGGYPASCNGLGVMYANGMGVPADGKRAVELYEQACAGEISTACLHAAMAYEGRDVAPDWKRALGYYERACELGATQGCQTAAKAFVDGDRVGRDPKKARKLYDLACKEDDAEACAARDALDSSAAP